MLKQRVKGVCCAVLPDRSDDHGSHHPDSVAGPSHDAACGVATPDVSPVPMVKASVSHKWWNLFGHRSHRGPSWDCRAELTTATRQHDCIGHANGRPEYMHRCECGFRWAA